MQQSSYHEYQNTTTLNYRGEQITQTHQAQWHDREQVAPVIKGRIDQDGRGALTIEAVPPPQPVNVIIVPTRQPCQQAPKNQGPLIQRKTIIPGITPC
ncbi:hypothetical protein L0B52_02150 [Suttonella sp. R2A3]|uniref:hypothetical protein n=1 Tax=Suttonella sp. R2A3 TaxID=2908648 RepID=UPI001F3FC9E8|nr:hypothetical protein [Suttonella sp. R2A3]UJF24964.1 hypothetical protein L0B52_02150 [Suttonella sp. R2A3]